MSWLIFVMIFLLAIAIVTSIVHFLKKNALHTALGSLLTILTGLITSQFAPEAEGKADIALHFGPLGSITAQWLKVNTSKPLETWVLSFITVAVLTAMTLAFVYDLSRRATATARSANP